MPSITTRPLVRRRIALWYASAVVVALVIASVALRGVLRDALAGEFRSGQGEVAALTSAFFRAELPEYKTVDSTAFHVASEHSFATSRIEFVRPDGSVYRPSATRRRSLPPPLKAPVHSASFPLDTLLAPGWDIRVHTSGAALHASQTRLDWWLLSVFIGTVAFATLFGWWITGRALQPVQAMSEAALLIGSETRGARLPVTDPRDELGGLAQRFNALLARLDEALAQQRRFLAEAAHELRTPLGRMQSEVELALLDGPHPALERIAQDVSSVARLVDQLLQLARADAAPIHPPLTPGFLDDVVMDLVDRSQAVARARGVVLTCEASEACPAVFDRPLLERLIGVLLDNALRYTPRGGRVDVNVAASPTGAVLTIADTGIGLPAENRTAIFNRFHRGTEARAMAPDGSGLGLAIASWVAGIHGAALSLDSAETGGTIASVHFPAVPTTAAPSPTALASTAHS
jgi:signal transduction histidine kinase